MVALVDIGNLALRSQKRKRLTSWDDGSAESQYLKDFWPTTRDAVLREHPWNCATARALLAAETDVPAFGPVRFFGRLPDDLRVRACDVSKGIKWRVEGRRIATSAAAPLKVIYTARITDPNIYDALLIEALHAKLQFHLALPLTQKKSLKDEAQEQYDDALMRARSADGQEGTKDQMFADVWLGARQTGVTEEYGTSTEWV